MLTFFWKEICSTNLKEAGILVDGININTMAKP